MAQSERANETGESRVGIYIDFDNIVISRYNQLFGRGAFQRDRVRDLDPRDPEASADTLQRLRDATVDLGAILDFASAFGTTVVSRAYADWSMEVNAGYRRQLVARAVDLTQLFQTARGAKNGADIRLAVDVVEDLFRLPDLTHVVIVAGDSDYIPLTQKAKRLGRFVVGIGVSGATSSSLASACDEFADYDALPGVSASAAAVQPATSVVASGGSGRGDASGSAREPVPGGSPDADVEQEPEVEAESAPHDPQESATELLVRALRVGHARDDTDEWLHSGSVKTQMKRLDASFNEKALGFRSFTDFVKSRGDLIEFDDSTTERRIRLRD